MTGRKTKEQVQDPRKELASLADLERARVMQGYFKTGKGQYGEGDVFIGVSMPKARQLAKKYSHIGLDEIKKLLYSIIHEERMLAVLILLHKYKSDPEGVVEFYLENMKQVNSWDLVDVSAPKILGAWLLRKKSKGEDRSLLYRLARSDSVWERRIAILSTQAFIRNGDFADTIRIAEVLLHDEHDLMHKAVGWMLREVGDSDMAAEEAFLKKHCKEMPRTMLRYAVEKFPEKKKRAYMKGVA